MESQNPSDTLSFEHSDIIDDITLHKAKKGDIGACFDVGDACYDYYLDNTSMAVLQQAEKWFTQGLKLGSDAGFYPLGLVYMEYADALSATQAHTKKKLSYLLQAEYFFLKAFKYAQDTDACYQLGKLYFEHADILEYTMDTVPYRQIANEDTDFMQKQRQKKLQSAEKYFLMALTMGTEHEEMAHYMLGILYWQYAQDSNDSNKDEKSEWIYMAQIHFDKILHLQPKSTIWIICRLFFMSTEFKVAFKYFKRILWK